MPEVQLGAHTIRSHGTKVMRFHMHDWIILVLLIIIDAVLNIIEPFHRFVGKDMMTDLRYPMKSNTVPFWAVPVCSFFPCSVKWVLICHILCCHWESNGDVFLFLQQFLAILLPFVIFSVIYFKRRNVYDLHHAVLGIPSRSFRLCICYRINEYLTYLCCMYNQDFFSLCF